jgi:hypothetical protein
MSLFFFFLPIRSLSLTEEAELVIPREESRRGGRAIAAAMEQQRQWQYDERAAEEFQGVASAEVIGSRSKGT